MICSLFAALLVAVPTAVSSPPGDAFYDAAEENGYLTMVPQRPLASGYGARLSPDGRLLAVPVPGGLQLRSAQGRLLRFQRGDGLDISFSPDGKSLAWSGRVLLFDGSRERVYGTPLKHGPSAFLADGRLLFAEGPELKLLEPAPGMGQKKLLELQGRVSRVVVTPDGSLAAAIGGGSRKVTVFKLDGTIVKEFDAGDAEGRFSWHEDLALSPSGKLLAVAANDFTARVYTLDGALQATLKPAEFGDPDRATGVVFDGDARMISRGVKMTRAASSGTARRPWLMDRSRFIFADLQRRSGAVVFSSSRGGELSYERKDLQNGVFTNALLGALDGAAADADKDGVVSVDELRDYVSARVSKATGGLQNPTVDRDNLSQKFGF